MTISPRLAITFGLLLSAAACGTPGAAPKAPGRVGADAAADAAACRQVAYDHVQNLPAVRSGQTTYIPGGPAPYYEACMKQRGYDTYPPY